MSTRRLVGHFEEAMEVYLKRVESKEGGSRVSEDDVLFGYRLRLFDYAAARTSVSEACRVFGVHRSTYYAWKRRVERHGLEILRPRERRRPRLPNQLSPFVE
jgi:transposase